MKEKLVIDPIDKAKTICSCRKVTLFDIKNKINSYENKLEKEMLLDLKSSLGAGGKCGCCISPQKDPNNKKSDYLINYIKSK